MTNSLRRRVIAAAHNFAAAWHRDESIVNPRVFKSEEAEKRLEEQLDLYTAKVIEETVKWQPIETAPQDGTPILLYYPERNCCIRGAWIEMTDGDWETGYKRWMEWQVDDELYIGDEGYEPTHWMPLPPSPQGE